MNFPSLGQGRHFTRRKAPWVQKEGASPHNMCANMWITTAGLEPILEKKLHIHLGEGPKIGQVWKKKPDDWLKVNKTLEELSYINDLATSFLCSSSLGGMPTHFFSGCVSLPGFYCN